MFDPTRRGQHRVLPLACPTCPYGVNGRCDGPFDNKTYLMQDPSWELHKLPVTAKTIKECTESFENFLLRRIEWMTEHLRQEGIKLAPYAFIKRTGASRWVTKSGRVQTAINNALLRIQ